MGDRSEPRVIVWTIRGFAIAPRAPRMYRSPLIVDVFEGILVLLVLIANRMCGTRKPIGID